MPCSQMIRMNISPPRPRLESRLARLPAVNGRIRNSESRNIGSATRVSITQKPASTASPPTISPSTTGLVQPIVCPP